MYKASKTEKAVSAAFAGIGTVGAAFIFCSLIPSGITVAAIAALAVVAVGLIPLSEIL